MKTETRVKLKNSFEKTKIWAKKHIKAIVATGCCILVFAAAGVGVLLYFDSKIPADNPRNSEIANSGYTLEYNDRIIASLMPASSPYSEDQDADVALISVNSDGDDMQILSTDYIICLNFDGTWIYYINNSDNGNIYKMKPDGSQSSLVYEDVATSMIYDDARLYFYSAASREIKSIKTDGSDVKVLVENCSSTNLTIAGDSIYYFGGTEKRMLSRVNKDGGKETTYFKSNSGYSLTAYKGYLYFIEGEGEPRLYKVKIGSKKKIAVSDIMLYRFFIKDDIIYFLSNVSASSGGIYKMDLDGENPKVICAGALKTISVAQDRILSIDTGYNEVDIFIIDKEYGVVLENYDSIDEEKRTQEIYQDKDSNSEQ